MPSTTHDMRAVSNFAVYKDTADRIREVARNLPEITLLDLVSRMLDDAMERAVLEIPPQPGRQIKIADYLGTKSRDKMPRRRGRPPKE